MPRSKLFLVPRQPDAEPNPNNLPALAPNLIGRERDGAALVQLLGQDETRLLTLVGPGGIGKTTLAMWLAQELLPDFRDGVFMVELAATSAAEGVLPRIAATLGIREAPPKPLLETVKEGLGDKELLLLLDNFEQVLGAAAVVGALIAACPALKVIVTSRVALGLRSEEVYNVEPLAMPQQNSPQTAHGIMEYGAVALFVQRAKSARAGFALSDANAAAVAEITRRLDGNALAIELVAARTRLLSPQSILERFSRPLLLLTGGPPDAPERQRTMRDTIEWSYRLLDEQEQQLLRRLAVFAGSFAPRAAEVVCNPEAALDIAADDPAALATLAGLEALLEKSLLRWVEQADGADQRLILLETVREYAREQLEASGESTLLNQRHAEYYHRLAEQVGYEHKGRAMTARLAQFDLEEANLRAAINWLLSQQGEAPGGMALRILSELFSVLDRQLSLQELYSLFDVALRNGNQTPSVLRSLALVRLSGLARRIGLKQDTERWGLAALHNAEQLGDKEQIARALDNLGGYALIMNNDPKTARELSERALEIYRELGLVVDIAKTLNNLGAGSRNTGDYQRAERYYHESLQILREQSDQLTLTTVLTNLGLVIVDQRQPQRAKAFLVESIQIELEAGIQRASHRTISVLGAALLEEGRSKPQPDEALIGKATRLMGLATMLREQGGAALDPRSRKEFDERVAAARAILGAERFSEEWRAGQEMEPEKVLALVGESQPKGEAKRGRRGEHGLTSREQQVTALVMQGLSNEEIAAKLVLSERTVEMHVSNTLHKLGLGSRTQLAAWAVEHGVAATGDA